MFQTLVLLSFLCFSNANRISLSGNDWMITDSINYTAKGSVPGTVHTILLAANKIPDPYLGFNDVNLRFLVKRDWIFSKKFRLTPDFHSSNNLFIHLEQIDTIANITINKCLIGKTNNMFLRYVFSIPPGCLHSENFIQIDFQSPITYALEQSILYNVTVLPIQAPDSQHGEGHVQFIRKEPCSFSWDWGPAFAPIGIPRDLYIEAVNHTEIVINVETVNLLGYDSVKKQWNVVVMLSSENEKFNPKLKFELLNTTYSLEYDQPFDHNLTVSLTIPNNQVLRWWPNGHGEQPLYQLNILNHGQLLDSRVLGFRTVELIQEAYEGEIRGRSFYFSINSKPIYVKGSNWIPPDAFQERVTDEKFERLLGSAKQANINMLRVWGGGIYERRKFYEIADRLGIMLWHDFMFACSLYPVDEEFLSSVYNEITFQVKRLQHHPSIVLWAGNNENEAVIAENWYGIPAEKMNQTKDEYRKLYVQTIKTAIEMVDTGTNRPFVTSSPSNGVETIAENYIAQIPQDPLYGDVHFYSYQKDSWNFSTYPITRFLSETGIQSLPSVETWKETTSNESDLNINSSLVLHREHKEKQIDAMLTYIQSNLPLPVTTDPLKCFTQMVYLSQIHQAITLKSISDLCRTYSSKDMIDPKTSLGHNMGLMYWQIDDIWQAPTWATIEYGLKWKMSHYYVRHMYTPVYPIPTLTPYLANSTDETAEFSLYVVNDLHTRTRGDVICGVHTLDTFTPRLTFGRNVSFSAPGVQRVMNIEYSLLMKRSNCSDSNQCIIHCSYDTSEDTVGQTLFLNRPKNHKLINPNLQIGSFTKISPNDFNIVVTADRPVLFVWLDVPTNASGYYSRNGFHMFQPVMNISFHSWTPISSLAKPSIMSLFDVTQP